MGVDTFGTLPSDASQATGDSDKEDATLEDLLDDLLSTAVPVESYKESSWYAEQVRIQQERTARAEEIKQLRRPYHDRVLGDLSVFARIPLAHLTAGEGQLAEETRARIDAYLGQFMPESWPRQSQTLGVAAVCTADDYCILEEYQPRLMEEKDQDEPNVAPWELPYEPPDDEHRLDQGYMSARPDAPERVAEIKARLAQIMLCLTQLVTTAIDIVEKYGIDTHRSNAERGHPFYLNARWSDPFADEPLCDEPFELPEDARADALSRFMGIGMTEEEAEAAVSVLLEIPYSELDDAAWCFYDDEELYGMYEISPTCETVEGEQKCESDHDSSRERNLYSFYTVASDTICSIKTSRVSADERQPIASVVRDLASMARTDDEREALYAIETYNKLVCPLAIVAQYRLSHEF